MQCESPSPTAATSYAASDWDAETPGGIQGGHRSVPLGRAGEDYKGEPVVENGFPFGVPLHPFPTRGKDVAAAAAKRLQAIAARTVKKNRMLPRKGTQ